MSRLKLVSDSRRPPAPGADRPLDSYAAQQRVPRGTSPVAPRVQIGSRYAGTFGGQQHSLRALPGSGPPLHVRRDPTLIDQLAALALRLLGHR